MHRFRRSLSDITFFSSLSASAAKHLASLFYFILCITHSLSSKHSHLFMALLLIFKNHLQCLHTLLLCSCAGIIVFKLHLVEYHLLPSLQFTCPAGITVSSPTILITSRHLLASKSVLHGARVLHDEPGFWG